MMKSGPSKPGPSKSGLSKPGPSKCGADADAYCDHSINSFKVRTSEDPGRKTVVCHLTYITASSSDPHIWSPIQNTT
jgi:hypothetical protein